MANYRVVKRIQHNGKWYEPGEDFEIDDIWSGHLVDAGAIEAKEEPAEPAKAG